MRNTGYQPYPPTERLAACRQAKLSKKRPLSQTRRGLTLRATSWSKRLSGSTLVKKMLHSKRTSGDLRTFQFSTPFLRSGKLAQTLPFHLPTTTPPKLTFRLTPKPLCRNLTVRLTEREDPEIRIQNQESIQRPTTHQCLQFPTIRPKRLDLFIRSK